MARPQNEIEHGRKLSRNDPELIWGWGTPAGRIRARRRAALIAEGARLGPHVRALEIGCGTGDLLASLQPTQGMGIDFSAEMIRRAKKKYPHLRFILCDAHEISLNGQFDVIILSDLVNDLWDVQAVLSGLDRLCSHRTRIIINTYSRVWELPLLLTQKLGLSTPLLPQNWLTVEDICNLLHLAGYEDIRHFNEILWPVKTPILAGFFNRHLVKIWPFSCLSLSNFIVARKRPEKDAGAEEPLISVIVPARNEAGNIDEIFARIPEMGAGTELVFVEGNSRDNTYEAIAKAMEKHPPVSYTHLRAHETPEHLVCRLLLEKKK